MGRKEELAMLRAALQGSRTVLVRGVGGIGKTQLLIKALEGRKSSGRVVWLDIEGYRAAGDIMTALAMSSAEVEPEDTLQRVVKRLDGEGACIVLDGMERLTGEALDDVDDLLSELGKRTRRAQFVVTSQVDLQRTRFDRSYHSSG